VRPRPVSSQLGGTAGACAEGGSRGEAVVPVRYATFSPTTHHPKVVAPLKILFPLPDVVDAPLRRERAGDRAPLPVPTATPVKISGQYRFLDDVVSVLPIIRTPEVPIALPFEVLTTWRSAHRLSSAGWSLRAKALPIKIERSLLARHFVVDDTYTPITWFASSTM
jgi:hypothetical protein